MTRLEKELAAVAVMAPADLHAAWDAAGAGAMPLRDFDANGRVKVESKPDFAKRNIPSPNLADAFIMAFAPYKAPMEINANVLDDLRRMPRHRY